MTELSQDASEGASSGCRWTNSNPAHSSTAAAASVIPPFGSLRLTHNGAVQIAAFVGVQEHEAGLAAGVIVVEHPGHRDRGDQRNDPDPALRRSPLLHVSRIPINPRGLTIRMTIIKTYDHGYVRTGM